LYELAVVEETLLLLFSDVEEVKLLALVSEEELGATRVEFKVVNLGVVTDGSDHLVLIPVLDTDGHYIK
jgi:hypothetical protein